MGSSSPGLISPPTITCTTERDEQVPPPLPCWGSTCRPFWWELTMLSLTKGRVALPNRKKSKRPLTPPPPPHSRKFYCKFVSENVWKQPHIKIQNLQSKLLDWKWPPAPLLAPFRKFIWFGSWTLPLQRMLTINQNIDGFEFWSLFSSLSRFPCYVLLSLSWSAPQIPAITILKDSYKNL